MREDSKTLVAIMRQLRILCEEICLLLGTADNLMNEEGWKAKGNINVFANLKYTLAAPRCWIPQDYYRFYENDGFVHILPFVAVILDDWGKESAVNESLLTAGWFDYGSGNQVGTRWSYYFQRWHLKMPGRRDNGQLVTENANAWPKESLPFARVSTLAVPLTSIADANELKSKIIGLVTQGIRETQLV
jgi:hypothetical protein